ncbi:hypothetical protein Tco_0441305 [Tanacetum coccineum]
MITYALCQRTTGYDRVQKNKLWLLTTFEANHQNGYANVTWLIAKWLKKKGVETQRESMICYVQFVTKIAKKHGILSDEVLNGLTAPTYCRQLDSNTLRELIGSNRRLIPDDIAPTKIKRMTRRQSYHLDRYAGVLEHLARHYGVTLLGAYDPPSYFEQQQQDDQE